MQRRTQAIVVALAALTTLALVTAPSASAQEQLTAEELGLEIVAGFGDEAPSDRWLPVEIRLAPTRVFAGTLSLDVQTAVSRVVQQRDIEVPAGSEKVFRFLLPPTDGVRLTIDEDGRDPLQVGARTSFDPSRFLVGVLGALPQDTPTLTFAPTQTTATWVGVDATWLEVSPRSVHALTTLIVTDEDLAGLSDLAVSNLVTAVTSGLDLVVTVPTSGPVELGLPWTAATEITASGDTAVVVPGEDATTVTLDELDPDAPAGTVVAAAVEAGRGRLTVTGARLTGDGAGADAALWNALVPLSTGSVDVAPTFASHHNLTSIATEALSGQGLTVPSLPWLTAFLLGYVLLVGPINWLVLRRLQRPELAWATVPVVTLAFAAGGFLAATGAQPAVGIAGRADWWLDGVGGEVAAVIVRSPTPERHEVALDGGNWDVVPENHSNPSTVATSSDGVRVDLPLESLQVGTVLGWRPASTAPPLDVTARVDGRELLVDVTNTHDQVLEDARVELAGLVVKLRDLDPGETRTEVLDLPDRLRSIEPYRDAFEGLRAGNGRPVAPVALGALLDQGLGDGSPGTVFVTGTYAPDDTAADGVVVDGRPAEDLGRFVAVGVTPAGTAKSPALTTRALLPGRRGGNDLWRVGPHAVEGNGDAILRFRMPPAGGDALVATLGRSAARRPLTEPGCFQEGDLTICPGGGGIAVPEEPSAEPALPDCPPDATCSFEDGVLEVCFPDGSCEVTLEAVSEPAIQPFGGPLVALEVWDHAKGAWLPFDRTFFQNADGEIVAPIDGLVSPLGEVYVRASGELFPFDYSHRGLTLREGGLT